MGKEEKGQKREREKEDDEVPSDYYPSDDSVADEDFVVDNESEVEEETEEESEREVQEESDNKVKGESDSDVEIIGSSSNNNNNNNNVDKRAISRTKSDEKKKKQKKNASDEDCEVPSISPAKSSSKKSKTKSKKSVKSKGKKKSARTPGARRRGKNDFIWDEHDADNLEETIYIAKEAPQPEGLRVTLLSFQKESLEWMIKQEKDDKAKGGILADDMGMGKTLQAISLVLTNRPDPSSPHRTTLVVCPVVALVQWHTEILKYTKANTLKILLYLLFCFDD